MWLDHKYLTRSYICICMYNIRKIVEQTYNISDIIQAIMNSVLSNMVSSSCATISIAEGATVIPGSSRRENETGTESDYKFIAKPLHLIACDYTYSMMEECPANSTGSEDDVCSYTCSSNCVDDDIVSPTDFGFGITEEIINTEMCNENILIDKTACQSSVQSTDTLSLCSILDQIPEGEDFVDGNVNIELYLECSDDNENTSLELINRFKPNLATSQIKMDTQFKVSFPLIPERGLKCSICKLLFLSKDFLREHAITKHFTDFLFCNVCSYFTKSKKFFSTHVQTRHLQSSGTTACLSLQHTQDSFTEIDHNKKDRECVEEIVAEKCPDELKKPCNIDKQSPASACRRMKKINEKLEYNIYCNVCQYKTKSNRLLNYHKQTMHNTNRTIFKCSECNYTCLQRRSFVSHQRKHSGSYEFHCKDCGKKFVSKYLLTKHSKKHRDKSSGNSNTKDQEKTELTLVGETAEIRPRSISTQTKLVKTPSKREHKNLDKVNLNQRHATSDVVVEKQFEPVIGKISKKKFKCTFSGCTKAFRDSFNLQNHLSVHSKYKTIKCALCSFTCIQVNSLNHHMKTRHK